MTIPQGIWSGTIRNVFEPGADEIISAMSAETPPAVAGRAFDELSYTWIFGDKPQTGKMMIGTDLMKRAALVWTDSFHTGGALGVFEGQDDGSYLGSYAAGDQVWQWRIRVQEGDELRIEHYNIMPGEEEYLAVEFNLRPASATPATS